MNLRTIVRLSLIPYAVGAQVAWGVTDAVWQGVEAVWVELGGTL